MFIIEQYTVQKDVQKIRLLDYSLLMFTTIPSRSSMKKVIKRGALLVDGNPGQSSSWVVEGQIVTLIDLELTPPKILRMNLEIIFEDEHLAIIIKPAGIEVSGNKYYTIQNALAGNIKISTASDALRWARPVHRLDRSTSGLLMVAKTASALMKLGQQLENREVLKKYCAIVAGNTPDFGEIITPIDGHNAKSSYTCIAHCHSLKTKWLSMVELLPHTGRTHQLRIHMSQLGFPIVGDRKYCTGPLLKGKGLFLAAVELSFLHPITNVPLHFKVAPPNKFKALLVREERRWRKYNTQATATP